jgi:aquaporin rerated protein, other eukaryote
LGLCLIKAVPAVRGLLVFPCQILGAIAAAGVVSALFPGPLVVGVSLSGGTSIVQGLFIEMFLTIQLVFVVFMLAAEKHRGTFIAPIGIGLSLFIAHMTGKLPRGR